MQVVAHPSGNLMQISENSCTLPDQIQTSLRKKSPESVKLQAADGRWSILDPFVGSLRASLWPSAGPQDVIRRKADENDGFLRISSHRYPFKGNGERHIIVFIERTRCYAGAGAIGYLEKHKKNGRKGERWHVSGDMQN